MIFAEEDSEDAPLSLPAGTDGLLLACAQETSRLAAAIAAVDQALSVIVAELSAPPVALQSVDLLRQEAEGLAAVLHVMAEADVSGHELEPSEVTNVVTLHDQRVRLLDPRQEKRA